MATHAQDFPTLASAFQGLDINAAERKEAQFKLQQLEQQKLAQELVIRTVRTKIETGIAETQKQLADVQSQSKREIAGLTKDLGVAKGHYEATGKRMYDDSKLAETSSELKAVHDAYDVAEAAKRGLMKAEKEMDAEKLRVLEVAKKQQGKKGYPDLETVKRALAADPVALADLGKKLAPMIEDEALALKTARQIVKDADEAVVTAKKTFDGIMLAPVKDGSLVFDRANGRLTKVGTWQQTIGSAYLGYTKAQEALSKATALSQLKIEGLEMRLRELQGEINPGQNPDRQVRNAAPTSPAELNALLAQYGIESIRIDGSFVPVRKGKERDHADYALFAAPEQRPFFAAGTQHSFHLVRAEVLTFLNYRRTKDLLEAAIEANMPEETIKALRDDLGYSDPKSEKCIRYDQIAPSADYSTAGLKALMIARGVSNQDLFELMQYYDYMFAAQEGGDISDRLVSYQQMKAAAELVTWQNYSALPKLIEMMKEAGLPKAYISDIAGDLEYHNPKSKHRIRYDNIVVSKDFKTVKGFAADMTGMPVSQDGSRIVTEDDLKEVAKNLQIEIAAPKKGLFGAWSRSGKKPAKQVAAPAAAVVAAESVPEVVEVAAPANDEGDTSAPVIAVTDTGETQAEIVQQDQEAEEPSLEKKLTDTYMAWALSRLQSDRDGQYILHTLSDPQSKALADVIAEMIADDVSAGTELQYKKEEFLQQADAILKTSKIFEPLMAFGDDYALAVQNGRTQTLPAIRERIETVGQGIIENELKTTAAPDINNGAMG